MSTIQDAEKPELSHVRAHLASVTWSGSMLRFPGEIVCHHGKIIETMPVVTAIFGGARKNECSESGLYVTGHGAAVAWEPDCAVLGITFSPASPINSKEVLANLSALFTRQGIAILDTRVDKSAYDHGNTVVEVRTPLNPQAWAVSRALALELKA